MYKLKIKQFGFEITRRCNLKCDFCLRGDSQNIDLQQSVVDYFFEEFISQFNEVEISEITLSGGEPMLSPQGIKTIIKQLISHNVVVKWLNITTNGLIYDEEVVSLLNQMNDYCKFDVELRISADRHHLSNREIVNSNIQKYQNGFKGKFKVEETIFYELPSGRQLQMQDIPPERSKEFISYCDSGNVFVPLMFLTVNGDITNTVDYSFIQVDKYNFGNITNVTIDKTFMNQVVYSANLGEQLTFGDNVKKLRL